jgi:hypothetical protein
MRERVMRGLKVAAVGAGMVAGVLWVAAPVASAALPSVSNGYGHLSFNDDGDSYTVCDDAGDNMSAIGRISVKQADGSWSHFAWVADKDGTGDGDGDGKDCSGNNVDIIREQADVRLTVCRKDYSNDGPIRDCAYRTISG